MSSSRDLNNSTTFGKIYFKPKYEFLFFFQKDDIEEEEKKIRNSDILNLI